jgi:hypothetical protein
VNGKVDNSGRAIVLLLVQASANADTIRLAAWVDTVFTGDLVIPRETIERLGLQQSAAVTAKLADGTQVVLSSGLVGSELSRSLKMTGRFLCLAWGSCEIENLRSTIGRGRSRSNSDFFPSDACETKKRFLTPFACRRKISKGIEL